VFHEIYTEVEEYPSWKRGKWPWWVFYGLCTDVERARVEAPLMSTEERVREFGTPRLLAAFEDFGSDLGGFQQEHECEFWDDEGAFLPTRLNMSCEADYDLKEATEREAPIGLGIDVGRDKSRTAVIGLQRQKILTTVLIDIMHKVPFPQQETRIAEHITELNAMRTCIDRGGMGRPLLEYLQQEFGRSRVEGVNFTQASKEEMMTRLKALFERRQIVIPAGDKKLRADLNKIRQIPIKGGGYRYYADMDDSGHADRAWALALAIRAAGKAKPARGLGQKVVRSGRRRSGW
jgi:phage FluMu gp28-like protein